MKCPACGDRLSSERSAKLNLDVCKDSCGGVWFDGGELAQVDESHEPIAPSTLRSLQLARVPVDIMKTRHCPKCSGQPLVRQLYDSSANTELDMCHSCGGIWLDLGELEWIRKDNDAEETR